MGQDQSSRSGIIRLVIPLASALVCITSLMQYFYANPLFSCETLMNSEAITENTGKRSDGNDNAKNRRYLNYFQTYRYIPPLSRNDSHAVVPNKQCGSFPDFESYFQKGYTERSSGANEDKIIFETFFKPYLQTVEDLRHFRGTYVELGAFDGIRESNSRFFDDCLGWNGLLIEGNPLKYIELIPNRPFSNKMSMAPSCKEGGSTIQFWVSPFTNAGLEGKALAYVNTTAVSVPCGPFTPILIDVFDGYDSINFMSLDVEGAEYLVLETMDFAAIPRIDILMIEAENMFCKPNKDCLVRNQVRERMHREGYLRYSGYIARSDVYVHPKSRFQMPPSGAQTLSDDPTNSSTLQSFNVST
ncbi:methyltransferase FkbM domain containing protein [Nitzschia inconspicua]|uniref:Methyltransferase FkbM domain containing protein n=1 Tax=Nitzschia inconspicua TaxID=303405 RepID=A0A9K3KJF7_9STRA|nr:methyltransferase FkbM domain containing protein [Nitzschia inconspicua]